MEIRRRTRPQGGDGARGRLLDAARAALIEGAGEAEMADIARRAGLSIGLAYHHFGSKAGLFTKVVEDYYARYAQVANARYAGADWGAREQARTRAVIDFQLDDPFTATLLGPLGRTPEVVNAESACMARLIELGAANILAGRACGELEPGADASLDAAFVLGGLRQCVSTALALSPAPDRLALTRAVWSRIAGALGLAVGGPSHSGDNA